MSGTEPAETSPLVPWSWLGTSFHAVNLVGLRKAFFFFSFERACILTTITSTHRRTSTYLSFVYHIPRYPAQCSNQYNMFSYFPYVVVFQNTCCFPSHNLYVNLRFFLGLGPLCLMFNWAGLFDLSTT
ncbi:hypothetical protein QR685DRAFT_190435 [Neurospora intermedia]|uniref:Uncharacterized protein n=1 Tax=Neurospora intermedia TaxID=5142 RepID=A0ABR3DMS7_NEUIN